MIEQNKQNPQTDSVPVAKEGGVATASSTNEVLRVEHLKKFL